MLYACQLDDLPYRGIVFWRSQPRGCERKAMGFFAFSKQRNLGRCPFFCGKHSRFPKRTAWLRINHKVLLTRQVLIRNADPTLWIRAACKALDADYPSKQASKQASTECQHQWQSHQQQHCAGSFATPLTSLETSAWAQRSQVCLVASLCKPTASCICVYICVYVCVRMQSSVVACSEALACHHSKQARGSCKPCSCRLRFCAHTLGDEPWLPCIWHPGGTLRCCARADAQAKAVHSAKAAEGNESAGQP